MIFALHTVLRYPPVAAGGGWVVHACRLHSLESCPAPGHAPVSSPSRVPEAGEVEQVRVRVCRPGEAAGQQ